MGPSTKPLSDHYEGLPTQGTKAPLLDRSEYAGDFRHTNPPTMGFSYERMHFPGRIGTLGKFPVYFDDDGVRARYQSAMVGKTSTVADVLRHGYFSQMDDLNENDGRGRVSFDRWVAPNKAPIEYDIVPAYPEVVKARYGSRPDVGVIEGVVHKLAKEMNIPHPRDTSVSLYTEESVHELHLGENGTVYFANAMNDEGRLASIEFEWRNAIKQAIYDAENRGELSDTARELVALLQESGYANPVETMATGATKGSIFDKAEAANIFAKGMDGAYLVTSDSLFNNRIAAAIMTGMGYEGGRALISDAALHELSHSFIPKGRAHILGKGGLEASFGKRHGKLYRRMQEAARTPEESHMYRVLEAISEAYASYFSIHRRIGRSLLGKGKANGQASVDGLENIIAESVETARGKGMSEADVARYVTKQVGEYLSSEGAKGEATEYTESDSHPTSSDAPSEAGDSSSEGEASDTSSEGSDGGEAAESGGESAGESGSSGE